MQVLSFDLNTHCTGVFGAKIKEHKIIDIAAASIVVPSFKVSEHFPYMNSKKSVPTTKTGDTKVNSYVKKGEIYVSVSEKRKRDSEVRVAENQYKINYMSSEYGKLIQLIKPDLVLVEKNEMFNGILTIELLAKLTGTLIGVCSSSGIEYLPLNVNTVRKPYNVSKLCKEYVSKRDYRGTAEDLGKEAIREYLEEKYKEFKIKFGTLDESDAAIVFDYWFNHIYNKAGGGNNGVSL